MTILMTFIKTVYSEVVLLPYHNTQSEQPKHPVLRPPVGPMRCPYFTYIRAMTHTAINCGNIMAQLSCAIILPVCHSYLR